MDGPRSAHLFGSKTFPSGSMKLMPPPPFPPLSRLRAAATDGSTCLSFFLRALCGALARGVVCAVPPREAAGVDTRSFPHIDAIPRAPSLPNFTTAANELKRSTNSAKNESARRAGDDSARCAGDEGRNQRACGSERGRGRREARRGGNGGRLHTAYFEPPHRRRRRRRATRCVPAFQRRREHANAHAAQPRSTCAMGGRAPGACAGKSGGQGRRGGGAETLAAGRVLRE